MCAGRPIRRHSAADTLEVDVCAAPSQTCSPINKATIFDETGAKRREKTKVFRPDMKRCEANSRQPIINTAYIGCYKVSFQL
jgi:hypothetical protein